MDTRIKSDQQQLSHAVSQAATRTPTRPAISRRRSEQQRTGRILTPTERTVAGLQRSAFAALLRGTATRKARALAAAAPPNV